MPDSRGDVLEGAVAPVAEEPVAAGRMAGPGGKWPALDAVNVEQAVAVEVEQADTAAGHLGELMDRRDTVIQHETGQARGLARSSNRGIGCRAAPGRADDLGSPTVARPSSPARSCARLPSLGTESCQCGAAGPARPARPAFDGSRTLTISQNACASNVRPS